MVGPVIPRGRARRRVAFQVAGWAVLLLVLRLTVVPAESRDVLTPEELRASSTAAREWIERNLQPDGRYTYVYDVELDAFPVDYNEVRHAGVTMSLFQSAGRDGDIEAFRAGDVAVEWMLDRLYRHDGWAALTTPHGDRCKVGASGLMLIALAERRLATGDTRHDEVMRELGRFLARMQRPDGGFYLAWLIARSEPDYVGTSRYYPGEATWGLALLHEALPGEGWDEYARAGSIFLTTLRDEVEDVRFRPLPDHWAAYSMAEMVEWGLSDEEIEYARRLAGRFGFLIRAESQREHGLFGGPGSLIRVHVRAAAFGTWIEAMGALWRIAAADPRMADLKPVIEERLAVGASLLAHRQTDDAEALGYPRPEFVAGAWITRGETRMDDQQHALSGLLFAADALEGRTLRSPAEPLTIPDALP
ncbi:MAG: hypothetical protein OXG95_07085 [Chloroflexi bacterium]|nr:hypothetical protein [Chloroflexota bacterium]